MARDPNIDSFLALIEDDEFELDKLNSDIDNLRELIWYMDESRINQVFEKLQQKDDSNRDKVIKNLSKIYPLSRNLIFKIMSEVKGSDFMFVKGSNVEKFADMLKNIMNDIRKSSGGHTTKLFNDYEKEIANKQHEYETLLNESKQFKALKAQKQQLEMDIESLKTETDETRFKQKISQLQEEKKQLINKKQQAEDEYRKCHETINDIKNELSKMENNINSQEEELMLLRELIKKFPPDVEDNA